MLLKIFLKFFKIGLFTIGGGYSMLPVIQEAVCKEAGWLSDEEFLDCIALSNSLPGPLATNTACFTGYRIKGFKGALCALLGAITPSIMIILLIAAVFNMAMESIWIQAFFRGVRPAIPAIILAAVYRLSKAAKLHKDLINLAIALSAFALISFAGMNPVIAVAAAALIALVRNRSGKAREDAEESGDE